MDFKTNYVKTIGTYTSGKGDAGGGGLNQFMNTRNGENINSNGAFSVKLTHVLSPTMFYELSAGYYLQTNENYDRAFGNENPQDLIWIYGDSLANAERGWTIPEIKLGCVEDI